MLLNLFPEEDGVVAIRLTISWDVELDLGKLFSGSSTVGGASGAILMPGEDLRPQVITSLPASITDQGSWTIGPPKQHSS